MLTIFITAGMLLLAALAFKLYWREILVVLAEVVAIAADLIDKFIVFIRKNAKAIAFIIKHYASGRKTRTRASEEEIDLELCPDEVQDALKHDGDQVRLENQA